MENSKKLTFLDCMAKVTDPRKPYNQLHVFQRHVQRSWTL